MSWTEERTAFAAACQPELLQLIRDLCAIPAPSGLEDQRAAFCKDWFTRAGGQGVYVDEAKNVICPWGVTADNPVVVVLAHMDTVFPDLEPLPFAEDAQQFRCPGVTDDTAQLAVLMVCAKYLMTHCPPPRTGVLFVANACEEGLGNLKGSRQLVRDFGSRMQRLLAIDGTLLQKAIKVCVGSVRYRVTVRTEGGHSLNNFGNRNAIQVLASMIQTLYTVKVPTDGHSKTTYNVGTIRGGTSVNTIAQEAEMLYEYRSDSRLCMEKMETMFRSVIEAYRAMGVEVLVEEIGRRPCAGKVDQKAWDELEQLVAESIRQVVGEEPIFVSGSTDCNSSLAEGIPSICIAGCTGGGCHTRAEYLELDSLEGGVSLVLQVLTRILNSL